jgi:prevent-host-death family protein
MYVRREVGMVVGVAELRQRLAHYLELAAAGEEIVVTDRGRPTARLVAATTASKLDELVAAGVAHRPTRSKRTWTGPRLRVAGGLGDLAAEQRR